MRLPILILTYLCLFACIDKYTDSIELKPDGSAVFSASIYPCEPDSSYISDIRKNYGSDAGLKFDSAWFSKEDSLYSLNFRLFFENLLSWQNDEKIEKDLIGYISLKKIDSLENGYSFERIINQNAESEDGAIIPENVTPSLAVEQIINGDSAYWEYSLILPKGATLISGEPVDTAIVKSENPLTFNWKIPANEAVSKRKSLKASFYLPPSATKQKSEIYWTSFTGIVTGCIIMVLAIVAIVLLGHKLKKLSVALKELKNTERNIK
jgi:hypothetical protein